MRKTIFALALFTVILSFYVSKAELFLEDVELVEFEDEELGGTTTKTSTSKGSEKKAKTPTKTTKGTTKAPAKTPKAGTTTTTPTKKTDGKKGKDKKTPATTPKTKTAPKKSSTMKWVIIAVVVVLVGAAILYFACRGDDTEAEKDKNFKGGKEISPPP